MTDIPGQSPLTRSKTDWTSWLQLVFSVIVFIALVGMGYAGVQKFNRFGHGSLWAGQKTLIRGGLGRETWV